MKSTRKLGYTKRWLNDGVSYCRVSPLYAGCEGDPFVSASVISGVEYKSAASDKISTFAIRSCAALCSNFFRLANTLLSIVFTTSTLLGGGVRDKAVALDDQITIRPMITLLCSPLHRVWEGRRNQQFLTKLREILQWDVSNSARNSFGELVLEAKAACF